VWWLLLWALAAAPGAACQTDTDPSRAGGNAANVRGNGSSPDGDVHEDFAGNGGVAGAAAAGTGGVAGDASSPLGTAGSAGSAPEPTRIALRDARVGEAPRFDPRAVYFEAELSDALVTQHGGPPWAIAPVEAADDAIFGIDYGARAFISRDGRMRYENTNVPLRELRVDALLPDGSLPDIHVGEPEVDSQQPCPFVRDVRRRYRMTWDGAMLHTCPNLMLQPPLEYAEDAWYGEDGALWYRGMATPERIGPGGVTLAWDPDVDGGVALMQMPGGQRIAVVELPAGEIIATRMRSSGFWIALREANGGAGRSWVDVDFEGHVVASGDYAPLPEGIEYVGGANGWTNGGYWVIDGYGRLNEFALETGTDNGIVIVRRPMYGESDVPHRSQDWLAMPPHTAVLLSEPYLFTGDGAASDAQL
jgi:hypothetical protein